MSQTGGSTYLRDAVMTATPEQLQLLLYDGAIRFISQARDAIEAGQIESSFNLLTRAQQIVREMESGLRPEVAPQLCAQMAALYGFVFSKLVDANVNRDVQAVDDALKILRHQRETWAIVVEKVQQIRMAPAPLAAAETTASTAEGPSGASLSLQG